MSVSSNLRGDKWVGEAHQQSKEGIGLAGSANNRRIVEVGQI
jgi:hypothetical protein